MANVRKKGKLNIPCSICGEPLSQTVDVRSRDGIKDANVRRKVCPNGHRETSVEISLAAYQKLIQSAEQLQAIITVAGMIHSTTSSP